MAVKKKLRISKRYQEIFDVIQGASKKDQNFLWKQVNGKRATFKVAISQIDGEANRIELKLKEYTPEIKMGDSIFLKLDARDSAFKAEVLARVGQDVVLTFPDEIALNESRAEKRNYFLPGDEKYVSMKRVRNQVSNLSEKSIQFLVSDISERGLCLVIPESHAHLFELGAKHKLESLGNFHIERGPIGEVVFKSPVIIKNALGKESAFKVGIQLSNRLPPATLERFLVRTKMYSLQDEVIVRDAEFREKVKANISSVQKKLASKKKLKALFDALEVQRTENQYLMQHILLLCEVMSGLGAKLGWVSEKTIEKLIYAAYLHDIRLVQYPRLAKIPTKAEFDEIKDTLSEAERVAFMEAPQYSAMVASQDSDSFPDAIKILQQQKELPDGSGFPVGSHASHLAPLSCLFIVIHFFVDYVISYPDWTKSDFLKTYRSRLKGPYFTKIFDAMK